MRIMIVDDNALIIKMVEAALRGSKELKDYGDLCFATYTQPVEALDAIMQEAPDILILDLMMPEMTGMELLKSIDYNENSGFGVIILTAYPSQGGIINAAKQKIDFFLSKPFVIDELVNAVKTLLAKKIGRG